VLVAGRLSGDAQAAPGDAEGSEHQRVGGEWSAVETLRQLVFVHDSRFPSLLPEIDRAVHSDRAGFRVRP